MNEPSQALIQTSLGDLPLAARGKVRDIYDLGNSRLLFVATDRISAFDHVLATGITDKGRILTQLSLFWFDLLKDVVKNHLVTADAAQFPASCTPYLEQLKGRSMLVKRAEMFPVECVVRGYLSGSGWKDYQKTGSVCGITLPAGLLESDKLPEPIFTPAAKNNVGHDENISYQKMVDTIGERPAEDLRDLSIKIYEKARNHAAGKGVILADTKFEFGLIDGEITLADEVLTPDSSRYWPAETYSPGGAQPSFDKQYVRDYLESIHWNKQAPAPALPPEVVEKTKAKYLEAFHLITGRADL
ncbi:MAG: phosphoribosylaminoimidazolesuccinocarboxamide synthase [Acidobacteriales bacterium 59-55]|nr:MAG: phosphoribosylaminoimidazolesuccinocarboxamide synthase [Acidobacteriales bacterium 59-55]